MIEKRYYVDVDESIIDSKTRRQYTGVEDIADKLNELYTSNLAQGEIISKQIKQIEAFENDYFSIRDIASELKKENEQLKQNIGIILKYCREKGKYAMDMKETKAHNVLQRILNDGDVE